MDMRPLFKMHANVCQALANEHRLAIMYSLKEGEKRVGDLADEVGISVHNVSQHLRILRQALLVRPRKEGQTVYYSIANPKFMDACGLMRQGLIEEHQAEGESLQWAAGFLDSLETSDGSSNTE
jgi:ArsR family transcriptional regulator, virulence genes transcriptional regulator